MTASTLNVAGVYFAIVFGAGFVLGPIRVLLVEPQVGVQTAELVEAPVMLLVIVLAGRWISQWLLAGRGSAARLAVGLPAAAGVLVADFAVGVGLRGRAVGQVLFDRDPVPGAVYYALVGLFGLMPWLAGWLSRGRPACPPPSETSPPTQSTAAGDLPRLAPSGRPTVQSVAAGADNSNPVCAGA